MKDLEQVNLTSDKIKENNNIIFSLISNYLNNASDFINEIEIKEIVNCGVSYEFAFSVILAAAFKLDLDHNGEDKNLFNVYFNSMFHKLDANEFYNNLYYKNIKIPTIRIGNCEFKYEKYKSFEGFICNDIFKTEDGTQIPQIGFFEKEFVYPVILENGRLWMSVTPNEIETMKEAVDRAHGSVLTFGLGLGYFQYMISEKSNVNSITIIEMNEEIIKLFKKHILPQFKNAKKINIIKADAFDYAKNHMPKGNYDFVYTDLWHDVSDGIGMYLRMKKYEKQNPNTEFMYWIEKSILCYL